MDNRQKSYSNLGVSPVLVYVVSLDELYAVVVVQSSHDRLALTIATSNSSERHHHYDFGNTNCTAVCNTTTTEST